VAPCNAVGGKLRLKKLTGSISTLIILKHIIISCFRRRSSSVSSDNSTRRSMYHTDDRPWIDFVNLRCTASTASMFPIACGDQTGVQYFNNGRTYIANAFITMVLSLVVKFR